MLWRRWARCSGNNATQLCLPAIPLPYLQLLDTSAQFFELRLEEEYSRGRDHEKLLKSIGNEIYRLKKDLLHGLNDYQHDRTSDAWKKMESVWIGLDYAEQMAGSL